MTPGASSSTASRGASASTRKRSGRSRRCSSPAGAAARATSGRCATSRSRSSRARRSASSAATARASRRCSPVSEIIKPTTGRIEVGGRIGSLLELGAGFHPDFTGRENVYLNGSIHGLSRARVREPMDEIVAFAELEQFIDLPVRTYSSGMYMRLGFSVAAHIQSDVLLLDEVFAVGDEDFQRKCFGKIAEFKSRGGTIFFVSHERRRSSGSATAPCCCGRASSRSTGDARGDRGVPAAARRGRGSGGARGRPARVGKRRGAIVSAAARRRWRRAHAVRGRRAGHRAAAVAAEEGVGAPRVRSSCATTAGWCSDACVRHASLGWQPASASGAPLRARPAPARGRALPPPGRARRRRPASCCTRSRTASASSSSRRARRRAPCCSTAAGRCRRRRRTRIASVSSRTCPDWPQLMEIAPELQFRHYTLREAQLPPEAFVQLEGVALDEVAICCDLDAHVYNPDTPNRSSPPRST